MPTVIGINQVPPNTPRPSLLSDAGYANGALTRDILLAVLTQGMSQLGQNKQNIPNPAYGQTGSPGATFSQPPITPGTTSGIGMTPRQDPQQLMRTVPPRQGAAFANQPMLNAQQFDILNKLQTYQQNAAQAPYDLASKKASAGLAESKSKQIDWAMQNGVIPIQNPITGEITFQQVGGQQSQGGFNPADLSKIEDDALAGDEDAVAAYRYFKKRQGVR